MSVQKEKNEGVIEKGVEITNKEIDTAVNVADSFLDWLTGPPYSAPEPKESNDDVICHCTKR